MKICPRCETQYNKDTKFCSRRCANSRKQTEETKLKLSQRAKTFFSENPDRIQMRKEENRLKHSKFMKQLHASKSENRLKSLGFNQLNAPERRLRILKEQNFVCAGGCNIPEEWNGKPLRFEIDHIDGNRENNDRTNLRLICPNCHQQTPTYKSKNNKDRRITDVQIIEALQKSNSIYACLKELKMNLHGKNYNRVRKIIRQYNISTPFQV